MEGIVNYRNDESVTVSMEESTSPPRMAMKVDEDHGLVGPHSPMEGQHRVMDQTLCYERVTPCGDG